MENEEIINNIVEISHASRLIKKLWKNKFGKEYLENLGIYVDESNKNNINTTCKKIFYKGRFGYIVSVKEDGTPDIIISSDKHLGYEKGVWDLLKKSDVTEDLINNLVYLFKNSLIETYDSAIFLLDSVLCLNLNSGRLFEGGIKLYSYLYFTRYEGL